MFNTILRKTIANECINECPLFINGVMFNSVELVKGGFSLNYERVDGGCGFIEDNEDFADFLQEYGYTEKDFSAVYDLEL